MPRSWMLSMPVIEIEPWLEGNLLPSDPLDDATVDRIALELHRQPRNGHPLQRQHRVPTVGIPVDPLHMIGADGSTGFAG